MSSKLNVSITFAAGSFPAGTGPIDHVKVTMQGSQPANLYVVDVPPTQTSLSQVVNPDTYTVTVQAQDASNNDIGAAVTTTQVVTLPPVSLNVPSTVNTSVSFS